MLPIINTFSEFTKAITSYGFAPGGTGYLFKPKFVGRGTYLFIFQSDTGQGFVVYYVGTNKGNTVYTGKICSGGGFENTELLTVNDDSNIEINFNTWGSLLIINLSANAETYSIDKRS